jgi:hypothetical protein
MVEENSRPAPPDALSWQEASECERKSTITLFTRVRTTILAANLRAGSDCLERRFIAANVDLRSFKPVSAVEILIAYDLWSRILSTISGGRTRPQMKVA